MANRADVSRTTRDARGIIVGGGIAGIIAGIVMAMFAMGYAGMMGMGWLTPLRLIAATLYGVDALIGGSGVLLIGLIIHMMASAAFGIIFAALLPARASAGAAFGGGLLWGFFVWVIMTFAVISWLNPTMAARVSLISGAWFFEHLVFGAVLAITPGQVRSLSAEHSPAVVRAYPERRVA